MIPSPKDFLELSSPLLTDRTTIETDWACGMRRWWYKEEGGTGIVPIKEAAPLEQGREYHEDFAFIAEAEDPELGATELIAGIQDQLASTNDQLVLEAQSRRAGWIAANALYLEPATRRDYTSLHVEHELILDRFPLWVAVTPDRVLKRRSDSLLVVRDYKGVGGWGVTKGWIEQWPTAIQMHTLLKAVAEEYPDEKVGFAQVVGCNKGQEKDGKLRHPYVWWWWDEEGNPATDYYDAKRKGLDMRPVWEYSQGILEFVKRLGPEVAAEQFVFSSPVYLNDRLLDDLIISRTRREKVVHLFRDTCQKDRRLRMLHFEPKFSACRPAVGSPCPYLAACHNEAINRDPLASGLYKPREPHHELELIEKGAFNEPDTQ